MEVYLTALKLVAMGDEHGVVLPAEMFARLHVQADGTVLASETSDGIKLLTEDAVHEQQMEAGRRLMRKHEGVLRQLAGR